MKINNNNVILSLLGFSVICLNVSLYFSNKRTDILERRIRRLELSQESLINKEI